MGYVRLKAASKTLVKSAPHRWQEGVCRQGRRQTKSIRHHHDHPKRTNWLVKIILNHSLGSHDKTWPNIGGGRMKKFKVGGQ